MDIAAMSVMMNQAQVKQQAQISVMSKVMDQARENGNALTEMLQASNVKQMQMSVQPHLGGNIDIKS